MAQHPRQNCPLEQPRSKRGELALKVDLVVKSVRPNAWRGYQPKENMIKAALLPLLGNNIEEVERIFKIIYQQTGDY